MDQPVQYTDILGSSSWAPIPRLETAGCTSIVRQIHTTVDMGFCLHFSQVTMATKEGAERACVNKRPIIDGRRANVDLAYIGAKPKKEAPQQDGTGTGTRCPSVPSSPTSSEQSFTMASGTEWYVAEEKNSSSSFHGNASYDPVHPIHTTSSQAMIMPSVGLAPVTVSDIQNFTPSLQLTNSMNYYQRNIHQWSSSPCNTANLVTYVPHGGPVSTPPNGLVLNTAQFQPQGPLQPTKLMNTPSYVYTVPVWYVEHGGGSCGQISLDPFYSQAPLAPSRVNAINTDFNCGVQSTKLYPVPITYY